MSQLSALEVIREKFFLRCGEDVEVMLRDAARAEFDTVEALAHRMVGAAGALEEDSIARLAKDLMRGAHHRDGAQVASRLAALQAALLARMAPPPGSASSCE